MSEPIYSSVFIPAGPMLLNLLRNNVAAHGDATAIVQGISRISYSELEACSLQFAARLSGLEIGPGDPLVVILPNEAGFVITIFAIASINAIFVPLNPELKDEELDYFVVDSNARHIITNNKFHDRLSRYFSKDNRQLQIINIDSLPDETDYGKHAEPAPMPEIQPEADFLYHYSSGSTGLPKRVIRTQHHCVQEATNLTGTCKITSKDRIFCSIPLFHAHGMCNAMFAAIRAGATLVIMENPQPFLLNRYRALDLLVRERITVFPGVPFQFEALLKTDGRNDLNLVRLCFTAGSRLPEAVFTGFLQKFGVPIRQLYGSTETGSLCINLDDDVESTRLSVGRPVQNVSVQIRDDEGKLLPTGEEGNIAVSSPAMTQGYYGMADLNRTVFRNGYFLPGDLGRLDSEGRLYITGRKRQFIEVVGHKVDPAVIEQCLLAYPPIREAIVVAVAGAKPGEEAVKAIVVTDGNCTESNILDYCRSKLASFEVPQIIEIRDRIERDSVGKVQIKRLTG